MKDDDINHTDENELVSALPPPINTEQSSQSL